VYKLDLAILDVVKKDSKIFILLQSVHTLYLYKLVPSQFDFPCGLHFLQVNWVKPSVGKCNDFMVEQSNNDHLQIATTCLQWLLFWGSDLKFRNINDLWTKTTWQQHYYLKYPDVGSCAHVWLYLFLSR